MTRQQQLDELVRSLQLHGQALVVNLEPKHCRAMVELLSRVAAERVVVSQVIAEAVATLHEGDAGLEDGGPRLEQTLCAVLDTLAQ